MEEAAWEKEGGMGKGGEDPFSPSSPICENLDAETSSEDFQR